MLKHYYISPKKRSKSQSSDTSESTEPAVNNHHDCLSDLMKYTKNVSRNTFHSSHEIDSCDTNLNLSSSADRDQLHYDHLSETSTPIQCSQKSYETRLSRMRLTHAFSHAVSYSRSRLAHLPAGASICIGHVYGNVLGTGNGENPTQTSSCGLTPPVRRWNSFHSTRGECHPNKFRRERKSTSPSIV